MKLVGPLTTVIARFNCIPNLTFLPCLFHPLMLVVTAYLMKSRRWRLETALNYVLGCHRHARPNRGFLQQLLNLENDIFGAELQDEEAADADI